MAGVHFIDGLTTVISLDRLLALILGMRYRQIVTFKRTSFVVVTIWVTATAAALLYFLNPCITVWHGRIGIPMCLTLSFASYTKISHTLRRRVQVQDHVQQEQQVQVVLIVCYLPRHIVITFSTESGSSSSQLVAWSITGLLAYLNSSLSSGNQCYK